MFRIKVLISMIIFSFLLIGTSLIKNKTREIEKKIFSLNKIVQFKEKDFNESYLDFSYLTSPAIIENKINEDSDTQYFPMDYSKIFLSISSYNDLENKFVIQNYHNEKIQKR